MKKIVAAIILVALSACMTGPNYKRPNVATPDKWHAPLQGGETDDTQSLAQWWQSFGDPTLDMLVARAIESNFDLRAAEARVREARANQQIVNAALWPQLNASGSYARTQSPEIDTPSAAGGSLTLTPKGIGVAGTGTPFGSNGPSVTVVPDLTGAGNSSVTIGTPRGTKIDRQADLFQGGFDASWELDIFGGNRRANEASRADTAAATENQRDVLVSLVAEVGRNYFELRSAQNSLEIACKNIEIQADSLKLTQARFEAGLTNELDVQRAQAQLSSTQATVPILETAISQYIHRLGVLSGSEPATFAEELTPVAALPAPPEEVPVGLPSDLLRRRPDIRRAERQLAAATARIGVATSDLFPKFSLTGSLVSQSDSFSGLTGSNSFWSIGPGVRWPIFEGGRIRANIRVQNARTEQALVGYEQTVMRSFEDVENSLISFAKEQERYASLTDAVNANQRAVDIAKELYAQGLVDFLNVLDAERALFLAEEQQIRSRAAILTDLVALYKAVGGGWDAPEESN
mgnify:CR=1 FL=1